MLTKEIRNQVFDTSSEVVKFLYSSSISGSIQREIAKKYLLDSNDKYKKFALTIGDIILGFYKIEDTIPLLQQELELDPAIATQLGAEVLDFLAPLSDPAWQPPVEQGDFIKDKIPPVHSSELATQPHTSFEPILSESENQHKTEVIPEIRTMASDMAQERSPARNTFNAAADMDEPVYLSTQPTLERTAIGVPTYTAPIPESSQPDENGDSRWS